MRPNQARVNATINWWGGRPLEDQIIGPTYPDGITCDTEEHRVDSYKIKSDDEGTD